MKWDSPRYVEIKMDAEIGSYQEDPDFPEFIEQDPQDDGETGRREF